MEDLTFNMKVAVDLALRDAEAKSLDEVEYRIEGATPAEVGRYLEELGFDMDDTSDNGVYDNIFTTYSKDGLCIMIDWDGWTGFVAVMGFNAENYWGNGDK